MSDYATVCLHACVYVCLCVNVIVCIACLSACMRANVVVYIACMSECIYIEILFIYKTHEPHNATSKEVSLSQMSLIVTYGPAIPPAITDLSLSVK